MPQNPNEVPANNTCNTNAFDESAMEPKSEAELTMQVKGIRSREDMFLQNVENVFYKKLLDATKHQAWELLLIFFFGFLNSDPSEKFPVSSKMAIPMFFISNYSLYFATLLKKGKLFKILVCFGVLVQVSILLLGIACAVTAAAAAIGII
ncbi:hypothetical protein L1987_17428 [Smallanthus sonchifolius]|uniref:Uncharacterized protein n=1 Tax=Smallanthus sonchifolius TaxID=185202 RepID=A0ACB9IZ35_9ASTR|nr:hypothetical protein L1987_17428 [Smallanthus sonchifolius]